MAQQPASAAGAPASGPAQTVTDGKTDAQMVSVLADYLRHHKPSTKERQPDILEGRYQIDLTKPLPEFNTKTALAYSATDTIDTSKPLYALVCNPNLVQRHRAIQQIKALNHPNLPTLLAADTVLLSQPYEERFVIFYRQPTGKKLSDLLTELQGQVSEHFIYRSLVIPIASALKHLADLDVAHGSIRPDNIYFGDGPVLGDCVSEPCGYSQPFFYEPLERMQALPAGKGEGQVEQDFYALAVVVLYALFGAKHFADMQPQTLARLMLQEGVYSAITRNKEIPETFSDFLRGMFCMGTKERWRAVHVEMWLGGKRQNAPARTVQLQATRPFEFGETTANSRREVAHLLANDWVHIPDALHHNLLMHWISVGLRNKELAEQVARITRTVVELGSRNETQLNEQLMHLITLLDPEGPIRMGSLSFFIDGIDTLSVELYNARAEKDFQSLARFIELSMVNFWLEKRRQDLEYVMTTVANNMLVRLERLRVCIRNAGYGFGLERMLYELNPEMHCLSPMLAGWHVRSLSALLVRLDHLAPTLAAKDQEPVDRHIAAFIASKLNLQHDIRMHDLEVIPLLAANRSIIALRLLSMAQERAGSMELSGLTHLLGMRILPSLDQIHSRSLRQKIKTLLVEHAQSGYLRPMAELIINSGYAPIDRDGFGNALTTYRTNAQKIIDYRAGHLIDQNSIDTGFTFAKTLAYIAFLITLVNVVGYGG